jgi:hypothetical protein
MTDFIKPQNNPNTHIIGTNIWDLVIEDMKSRDEFGFKKYGGHLQAFNGRSALVDAYQEALDLVVYLRQVLYEEGGL